MPPTTLPIQIVSEQESIYRQTLAFQEAVMDVPDPRQALDETQQCLDELEEYLAALKISADDYLVSDQVEPCWNVLVHLAERRFDREFVKWILTFLQGKDPKFQISLAVAHPNAGTHVSGSVLELSLHRPWVAQKETLPLMIAKGIVGADGITVSADWW